jgi:CRP/FNR family transcriptional regulator, cyclic AMP receptor protein
VSSPAAVGLILDLDPDLGSGVGAEEWEWARSTCRGGLMRVPPGAWQVPDGAGERADLLGWLIVEGLVCREVGLRDRYMLELLGPGDVLQFPVEVDRPRLGGPVRLTAAFETALIALGDSFARAAARWPCLLAAIHRRLEVQRESLAIQGLIAHLPRVEHRLLLMLSHLAGRWGRVTTEGTLLPLTLTHDLLGHLTAARRPTVSLAVGALESDGYIRRTADGAWLLTSQGEHRARAVGRTSTTAPALGETFMFRQRTADIRRDSLTLRAEARQLRARRAANGRPPGAAEREPKPAG